MPTLDTSESVLTDLLTELVAAWNSHDVERAARCYASDFEGYDTGYADPLHGLEDLRRNLTRYLNAFPDLHFAMEEMVVQGDRVALVWKARGTHRGTLMNIPATGRSVEVHGVSLFEFYSGKVRRGISIWDVAGFLRGIGLLPVLHA